MSRVLLSSSLEVNFRRLRPARIDGANAPAGTSDTSAVPNGQWRTPEPTDVIFPKWQRELFKTILEEEKLRFDREGQPRTAYSLRHTNICLRLMEGADIDQSLSISTLVRLFLAIPHQDLSRRRCKQCHAAEEEEKVNRRQLNEPRLEGPPFEPENVK
jgi:hypothetical protein